MSILRTKTISRKGQKEKSNQSRCRANIATGNSPFLLAVPDYIQADWFIARPQLRPGDITGQLKRGRQRIGGGLYWAILQAVIVQKTARVILADVVLGQVL